MLCSYCGAMSGNAGFCTGCGKTLKVAPTVPQPSRDDVVAAPPSPSEPKAPLNHQPAPGVTPTPDVPIATRRDPRRKSRLLPILAFSLLGLFFVGGSGLAVWWLFLAPGEAALSPDSRTQAGQYGSDATLDELWDACEVGSLEACDELYLSAAAGTEYEAFGGSCGDRGDGFGSCAILGGATVPATDGSFGSDAALDLLWGECETGSMEACDDLYMASPIGSDYEAFGAACGGRGDANGECVTRFP